MLDALRVVFKPDANKGAMRRAMDQAKAPAIPHIGIFLGDLTLLDEFPALPNEHINFRLCRRITGIIEMLQEHQIAKYSLIPIQCLGEHIEVLKGTLKKVECFALSKKHEPNVVRKRKV